MTDLDHVLTAARSVRLDYDRPVPIEVVGVEPLRGGQVTMLPVAYTRGTDFRPAVRKPVNEVAFLDRWGSPLPYEETPWNR